MSKATSGTESGIGSSTTSGAAASSPSIESGRFARAGTEAMTVERAADRLYSVSNGDGVVCESLP